MLLLLSDARDPQVYGRISVAIARARVAEIYSGVLISKQHLSSAAAAHQSDFPHSDHAPNADGTATAGGGDAAHRAAANFIESQKLEKGVGSDEEVR
jgi:hypothetical protein